MAFQCRMVKAMRRTAGRRFAAAESFWNRGRAGVDCGPGRGRIATRPCMKLFRWENVRQLRELLRETAPPPDQMALRLQTVERDVILPVKACCILIVIYNLFVSPWFDNVALPQ